MFGCGAVAQVVLSEGSHGLFLTVNLAFGFAATLGILVCGQVSGRQTPLKLHLKLLLCTAIKTRPSFYKRFFVDELIGWKNFFFFFPSLGGHLNPAVTFALCLLGREQWRKFPVYFLFQTLGSFLGAAIIFAEYHGTCYIVLMFFLVKSVYYVSPFWHFFFTFYFRCNVWLCWRIKWVDCNWAKSHCWDFCYLPKPASHHLKWIFWPGQ